MEIKIDNFNVSNKVTFNYDKLKEDIQSAMGKYENSSYDSLEDMKSARARLNKFSKALNDKRIETERKALEPLADFKEKINELIGLIRSASDSIDSKIKEIEEAARNKKDLEIDELVFNEYLGKIKLFGEVLSNEYINSFVSECKLRKKGSWLNVGITLDNIRDELNTFIEQISNSCKTVEEVFKEEDELIKQYVLKTMMSNGFNTPRTILEVQEFKRMTVAASVKEHAANAKAINTIKTNIVASTGKKEKMYSTTLQFVGTIEALSNLKEYLLVNSDIGYTVVEAMTEVE